MQKLTNFIKKAKDNIAQQTYNSVQSLVNDMKINQQQQNETIAQRKQNSNNINQVQIHQNDEVNRIQAYDAFVQRPLQDIELQQSKVINSENNTFSSPQLKQSRNKILQKSRSQNQSRIRQIENQKKRILGQLKKLDGQISQIKQQKGQNSEIQKSVYYKKMRIADDFQAKKQAHSLIKQLHQEKMKMEQKRKKTQQKKLQMHKLEEEQRKREKQQIENKIKEEKRVIIERRMQQQRKKRFERQIIDKQSNHLVVELKKQKELFRQRQMIPSQIQEFQQKKKLLQRKNIFHVTQIEQHQKKYQELKSKQKQLRRQRSQSIKVSFQIPKYGKNVWVQKIQQEQTKRKQQEKMKQLNRRKQLQKRMKYGDFVKNIFMSKHKKKEDQLQKDNSIIQSEQQTGVQDKKPRTPDATNYLPKINQSYKKRQNQTDKKFKTRQPSASIIENKKSRIISKLQGEVKGKDPQEQQKIIKQKQREAQIRKQTKQRLKKMQNQSFDIPKPEKIKYQNYISKVKVKKQNPAAQWKKIMENDNLSKEEKYKQMLNKAAVMQNQAKIKEDLRKSGDQEAVNLYIGSIQAKLALLQKF